MSTTLLLPYVLQAQTLYIEPKLGTQLYEHIKGLIQAGTIGDAGNVAYKTLLDDYISFVLVNYSVFITLSLF
jgi:hypothetical protein